MENYKLKKNIKKFEATYKNEKKKTIIKLGDSEIKNQRFHQYKRPISIKNIDIDKIFKYFIGYKDAKKYTFMYIYPKNECI